MQSHSREGPNFFALPSDNDGDTDDLLPNAHADIALSWTQPHSFSIVLSDGLHGEAEKWDTGAVNAIAAEGGTAIVGTRGSGVWLINPEYGAAPQTKNFPAVCLSYDWEFTNISALEWSPQKPNFLFAGLSNSSGAWKLFLLEFRTRLGGLDYVARRTIPCHASMGHIAALVFVPGPRVLVAVTDKGLWWTFVPTQVDMVTWYTWHRSTIDAPFSEFTSVCRISDDFSIAVAGIRRDFLDRIVEGGVLIGRWTGAGFTYTPASLPAGTQLSFSRLCSCEAVPLRAYLITVDNGNEGVGALLSTADGGATWQHASIPQGCGEQGDYNMCIAVHPSNPSLVVVGWQHGVHISHDDGLKWQLQAAPHSDQRALVFSEFAPGEFRLFVGSDGGVGLTADGGRTWDPRYNKHVLSLELYESRGFDPAPFDVNTAVEGIALCATQDNGNLWCPLDGMVSRSFPPWDAFRKFDGGDGLTTVLLDNASALWANGAFSKSGEVRIAALENAPSFPIFAAMRSWCA